MGAVRILERLLKGSGRGPEYDRGLARGIWLGGAGAILGLGGMLSVALAYGLTGAPRQAPTASPASAAQAAAPRVAAAAPAAAPAGVGPATIAVPVEVPVPIEVPVPAARVPAAARATVTAPAAVTPAATTAGCSASVVSAAVQAFLVHFDVAHLQRSPLQQVQDILSADQYVKTHTVLVQNMLQPLFDALPGTLDTAVQAFIAHLDVAHLQRSPLQQVQDILSADQYVKTHTVLVQNMLQTLFDAISGACSGSSPAMPAMPAMPAPAAPQVSVPAMVKMAQIAFAPTSMNVPVGGTVIWTNADTVDHTVTSLGAGPMASGTLAPGGSYSATFMTAGTYKYYCAIHPDMTGTVVVG